MEVLLPMKAYIKRALRHVNPDLRGVWVVVVINELNEPCIYDIDLRYRRAKEILANVRYNHDDWFIGFRENPWLWSQYFP